MHEIMQYTSNYINVEAVHVRALNLVRCCVLIKMDHFGVYLGKLKMFLI